MTINEHAQEFLNYCVDNEKRLKNNLRKNITYNEDIFDDVYNDTVIKVFNYIIRKEKFIKDFEQFFFICSKNNYIAADNKNKKAINNSEPISDIFIDDNENEYINNELYLNNINKLFKFIAKRVEEEFTPLEADIYIIYMRLKSEKNRISYEKFANITNTTTKFVSDTISKVKQFVINDPAILNKKKELLYD